MVEDPDCPPAFAVMVLVPSVTPVTTPSAETVATPTALLCQLACGAGEQLAFVTVALNWRLGPMKTSDDGGETLTAVTPHTGADVSPPDEHDATTAPSEVETRIEWRG